MYLREIVIRYNDYFMQKDLHLLIVQSIEVTLSLKM